MNNSNSMWKTQSLSASKNLVTALLLAIGLAFCSRVASAAPNPTVVPPNSRPYGASYSQWTAAWEQWAYGAPASMNPVTDTTGEFAAVGQHGPVWFLAGT